MLTMRVEGGAVRYRRGDAAWVRLALRLAYCGVLQRPDMRRLTRGRRRHEAMYLGDALAMRGAEFVER